MNGCYLMVPTILMSVKLGLGYSDNSKIEELGSISGLDGVLSHESVP